MTSKDRITNNIPEWRKALLLGRPMRTGRTPAKSNISLIQKLISLILP